MNIEENKKIVLDLFAAVNRGDVSGAVALLADDATWWLIGDIPGSSGTHNKQWVADSFGFLARMTDGKYQFIVDHMIAEGRYVAAEMRVEAMTPKGIPYLNRYHIKFEMKDGKVLAARAYNDTALIRDMMAQVQGWKAPGND